MQLLSIGLMEIAIDDLPALKKVIVLKPTLEKKSLQLCHVSPQAERENVSGSKLTLKQAVQLLSNGLMEIAIDDLSALNNNIALKPILENNPCSFVTFPNTQAFRK